MSDFDIREWARTNGLDIADSGPIPQRIRNRYIDATIPPESDIQRAPISDTPPNVDAEVPPKELPKSRQTVKRARSLFKRTPAKRTPARTKKPRVSIDSFIQRLWKGLANSAKPINLPVSRVLALQSPVAGLLLEETVRGTVVDRAIQPFARAGKNAEVAEALLGPPLLVFALTAKPTMAPLLVPMLKDALRTWVDVAGPMIEKATEREEEFEKKYGTKIDEMISFILAAPEDDESVQP